MRALPVPAGCRCLEIEGLEGDAALDHSSTRLDRTSVPDPAAAGALTRPDRRTGLSAGGLTAPAISLLIVGALAAIGVR